MVFSVTDLESKTWNKIWHQNCQPREYFHHFG
jgi:hypothetical protein